MTVSLVTVGGMIRDCVVASDGTLSIDRMGGNAVYSAIGARQWGAAVGILANIPADYPADWLGALEHRGVSCAGVRRHPETVAEPEWFFYAGDGSRLDHVYASLSVLAEAGVAGPRLAAAEVERLKAAVLAKPQAERGFAAFRARHPVVSDQVPPGWRSAAGVHLAPGRFEALLDLTAALRPEVGAITLDPGADAHGRPLAAWLPLLAHVDAFLPSEKELAALMPGRPAAAALASLADAVPCHVVVKLGAAGCLAWEAARRRPVHVPAFDVAAVDPTGAGDAFCGGFLAGLAATGDPIRAACWGTVSASFAVERFGALAVRQADHRGGALDRLAVLQARIAERVT